MTRPTCTVFLPGRVQDELWNRRAQALQKAAYFPSFKKPGSSYSLISPARPSNFARTCRRMAYWCWLSKYFRSAWKVNALLDRTFTDPRALRNMQAATSTPTSGSAALQSLDRTRYHGSDLDLYVWYYRIWWSPSYNRISKKVASGFADGLTHDALAIARVRRSAVAMKVLKVWLHTS